MQKDGKCRELNQGSLLKRAGKQLLANCRTDFAPGENHIKFRKDGVDYYAPNLFHNADTLNYDDNGSYLPMLIKDILLIKDPRQIYHNEGYEPASKGISLYMNHPVRNISLLGRVVSEKYRESSYANKNGKSIQKVTYFLEMNDSSTDQNIQVKIDKAHYLLNNLSLDRNFSKLIKVCGKISFFYNFNGSDIAAGQTVEVHAESLEVVGSKADFRTELDWWKLAMLTRKKYLLSPWTFDPMNNVECAHPDTEVSVEPMDLELLQLEIVFVGFLMCNVEHDTIKIEYISRDKALQSTVKDLGVRFGSSDVELLYSWLLKKFTELKLIKWTPTLDEMRIRKFQRIFKYIKNLVRFLAHNQESEIRKLIVAASSVRPDEESYRFLKRSIKQLVKFSINLSSLQSEIMRRFNLPSLKMEYLNKLIEAMINDDYIISGGIATRRFSCKHGYCIMLMWIHKDESQTWDYVAELVENNGEDGLPQYTFAI
ncbi:DEKNAAC105576 [Brettanomyces naardenensis]|uniref:DEKNAAC105576 n=1 Tax=Brettanomyces naardenensis TaxID=13370 RepID=A0A448YTQ0_BRENA|nr:DEKNAAC105576 [Brettanomyces naardenensis]